MSRGLTVAALFALAALLFALTRPSAVDETAAPAAIPDQWLGQRATALATTAEGVIFAGDEAGRITVFHPERPSQRWVAHAGPIRQLTVVDGALYSGSADGSLARWLSPQTDAHVDWRWRFPNSTGLNSFALAPDGRSAFGTAEKGMVARFGPNGAIWARPGIHKQAGFAVALLGDRLYSGGTDGWLRPWALDGTPGRAISVPGGWITDIVRRPGGLLLAGSDGRAYRWQNEALTPIGVPGERLTAIATDSRWAALGDETGRIRLYALETGIAGPQIAGPDGAVFALAFDGETLLSAGGDDGVRRWRVTDGRLVGTLRSDGE